MEITPKDNKEFPLEIHGTPKEGFIKLTEQEPKPEDTVLPAKGAEEAKPPEGGGKDEGVKPTVEPLSMEELIKQHPNLKVRMNIAGQEVVKSVEELSQYHQRYAGQESTRDRQTQEISRLLQETKRDMAELKVIKAKPAEVPVVAPEAGTPEAFVGDIIDPRIKALNDKIDTVVDSMTALNDGLKPQLGEGRKAKAKALLKQNQVRDYSDQDFDANHDNMVSFFERRVGRSLSTDEIATIEPSNWVFAFQEVRNNKPVKAEDPPPIVDPLKAKEEAKRRLLSITPRVGTGAQPVTEGSDLKKAIDTGDFLPIIQKRVKPMLSGG